MSLFYTLTVVTLIESNYKYAICFALKALKEIKFTQINFKYCFKIG